jgi:hypothetical protein
MKRICILLLTLFALHSSFISANTNKKNITLNIQFDSAPNPPFYDHPLHIRKIIKLNTAHPAESIVMTESKIMDDFPVTLVMLVKPVNFTNKQLTIQFHLLHYGFKQAGSIITQPSLVLANGQRSELNNKEFKLNVVAHWSRFF